jgi:hypothetical protein
MEVLSTKELVTYYFIKAWATWEDAHEVDDWLERSFAFGNADTYLYQAVGIAGLKWPWKYESPRKS